VFKSRAFLGWLREAVLRAGDLGLCPFGDESQFVLDLAGVSSLVLATEDLALQVLCSSISIKRGLSSKAVSNVPYYCESRKT
jgi:hypothetical protein